MSNKTKRFILPEDEIPRYWYNIQADMVNKPMPPLNPATKQPLKAEDLYPIFAQELCRQGLNQTDAWIEIPEQVREMYKYYRSTPLVRAYGLEKALGTPAHIYFKNESVSPMGSHKLNSALPQAYYCKQEGVTNVTTETGAGQWGASLAYAARLFGLEAAVYQVKISYEQKPYRRSIMQTFGAQVTPFTVHVHPRRKRYTDRPPQSSGVRWVQPFPKLLNWHEAPPNCKYTLGSVLSHVTLHQTVIGLEAEKQMEMAGEYPDMVIACFGGGSNFGGITFPFMRHTILEGKKTRFIAAEPASCPKFRHAENSNMTSATKPDIPFAANVYTGTQLCSCQHPCRRLALSWRRRHRVATAERRLYGSNGHQTTRIVRCRLSLCTGRRHHPAPESCHAIAATIREANKCKETGEEK